MSKIGYHHLSLVEKKAYELYEMEFERFSCSIDCRNIDKGVDLMKVLQVALADNPQVVYFNKTQVKCSNSLTGGRKIELFPLTDPSEFVLMSRKLEEAVQKVVQNINMLNPVSNYDKLILIYEFIQDCVSYDDKDLEAMCSVGKSIRPESHNAYGALCNKLGVCDGISAAFSLIAERFGFDCSIVTGNSEFRASGFSGHAWNVIKVGNYYFHVDATFDMNHKQQTGHYSYDYFCVSDLSIQRDHQWEASSCPSCFNENLSYHYVNRCIAHDSDQIDAIFRRFSKSKKNVVRAKVIESYVLPKPEDQYLVQKLSSIATSVGRYSAFKYFWNKNSRCFYAEFEK